MIEKVLTKVVSVVKNSAEECGQKVVRRVNNDFVRSPKADCLMLTNPIVSNTLISKEQVSIDKFINTIKQEQFPKSEIEFFEKISKHKNPDGSFRFDVPTFWKTVEMETNQFKRFMKLVEAKTPEGEFSLNKDELMELSQIKSLNPNKIDFKKLDILKSAKRSLDNKLTFEDKGVELALLPDGIDLEKLLPKLKEKLAVEKDNLTCIKLGKPEGNKGDFTVRYEFENGNIEKTLFDKAGKSLNYTKTEVKAYKNGQKVHLQKIYDARTNSSLVIKNVDKDDYVFVEKEKRVIKDKAGHVIRKEILTPSQVEGIYDVKSFDADGNVKIISSGVKDENGCVTVKKNLESLDGTKTQYEYYDDPAGNRITYYKIVDKKGKVLLNDTQSFEVVDKNTAISSHCGKSYEIKTDNAGMKVRNLQNDETTQIDYDKLLTWQSSGMKNLLSKISGEELIALNKKGAKLNYITDVLASSIQRDGVLNSAKNVFNFEHEAGHVKHIKGFNKDFHKKSSIMADKALSKAYSEERKAFMKTFPSAQQKQIDYFINKSGHYGGQKGGLYETIAESNGLLNSYQSAEALAIRTNYLQQYFPRTIAKAAELLES